MRRLLAVLALGLAAAVPAATPAVAGPYEWHYCPTEARGTVSHNGDASWVATSQSSRLIDMRIAPIGGITAMVCTYRMFGTEYWIYKHPSPEMPVCQPSADGERRPAFFCRPI
jgi:hypothetical protein